MLNGVSGALFKKAKIVIFFLINRKNSNIVLEFEESTPRKSKK
jgi:hypothetical protein